MIDIHCHILHGIDDGARDLETAVRLCEMAMENGIEKIIVTPHFSNFNELDAFIELRDQKLEELRYAIKKQGLWLEAIGGVEVYVGDDIFYPIPLNKAAINGSRYILIEFSFSDVGFLSVLKYVEEVMKMGLIPIIAHPERYTFFQENWETIDTLLDKGVLFQINAGSLASKGRRDEFELAYEMALKNAASFIATDAHSINNRPNDLLKMVRSFPPDISQRGLNQMLNVSPEALIKNKDISMADRRPLKKRRQ